MANYGSKCLNRFLTSRLFSQQQLCCDSTFNLEVRRTDNPRSRTVTRDDNDIIIQLLLQKVVVIPLMSLSKVWEQQTFRLLGRQVRNYLYFSIMSQLPRGGTSLGQPAGARHKASIGRRARRTTKDGRG